MGMADQYDDGRYDSPTMFYDPVQGDVPRFPVSAEAQRRQSRSDAYYLRNNLTPPKGTTMGLTPKQKVRKLEAELDANLTLQQTLQKEAKELRDEIRKADIPNQPPREVGDMFKVEVQFTPRGPHYTFLLARNANRWYTTGVHEDQKMFQSWAALCGWLNSTHWHSSLKPLEEAKDRVPYPTEYKTEPPF